VKVRACCRGVRAHADAVRIAAGKTGRTRAAHEARTGLAVSANTSATSTAGSLTISPVLARGFDQAYPHQLTCDWEVWLHMYPNVMPHEALISAIKSLMQAGAVVRSYRPLDLQRSACSREFDCLKARFMALCTQVRGQACLSFTRVLPIRLLVILQMRQHQDGAQGLGVKVAHDVLQQVAQEWLTKILM
jgi:hypothetical protein